MDSNFASQLKIKGPPNYRGTFEVEIRGSIIDVTNSNSVKTATRSSTLLIEINPVADMIVGRTTAIGTEDGGPIAFGAELKNGMRLKDETETTPPAMSFGIRPSAEDAVRAGIRHIQFAVPPEEDKVPESIDEYLKALRRYRVRIWSTES